MMIRLLIVEDEWLVAHFIADIAISQNFEVVGIAQSYDDVVKIICEYEFDCVIVDINIKGGKSGIEVAFIFKERNIPFFFLTAYKDVDTIQEATQLKPLSYLIKPVSQETIMAALLIAKNYSATRVAFPYTVSKEGVISKGDEVLLLSEYERIVFAQLIKNYRSVVSHDVFFGLLWNHPDKINEGTLRNIIVKLRKKYNLKINNVKNIGYCLVSVELPHAEI